MTEGAGEGVENLSALERARNLVKSGQVDAALFALRNLEAGSDRLVVLHERGRLHLANGELPQALEALQSCVNENSGQIWALLDLSYVERSLQRYERALDYLRRAAEAAPDYAEFKVNIAAVCGELGRWSEARREVRGLSESLGGWWGAKVAEVRRKVSEIRRNALRLLARRREDISSLTIEECLILAENFLALDKVKMSSAICNAMLTSNSSLYSAMRIQIRAVVRKEGIAAAIEKISEVKEKFPTDQIAWRLDLGNLLYQVGRYDSALEILNAMPRTKETDLGRKLCGLILLSTGQFEALTRYARHWISSTPDDTAPYRYALAAERSLGKLKRYQGRAPNVAAKQLGSSIPIFQFWHGESIPDDVAEAMRSWAKMHPDLDYFCFNARMAREFMLDNYGVIAADAFDICHHPAMKSDLFRVAYIARRGGVYVDADEICQEPLNPLFSHLAEIDCFIALSNDLAPYAFNAFIGALPNSVLLRRTLDIMLDEICRKRQPNERPDIWHSTGPGAMTRALADHLTQDVADGKPVMCLTQDQYFGFSRESPDLHYKKTVGGNWRNA